MAGQLLPSGMKADTLYLSVDVAALAVPAVGLGSSGAAPISGALSGDYVVSVVTFGVNGAHAIAPTDAFYERIYLDIAYSDIGLITTPFAVGYKVWNAFRYTSKTFSAWVGSNDDDTTMYTATPPPYTAASLEEMAFVITVSDEGAPVIEATYTWTVGGIDVVTVIVGQRSVLFPYAPDWSSPVIESLEWRTDVHRSYDGSEQRVSLRSKPRRAFEYRVTLAGQEAAALQNTLWAQQNKMLALPVWTDKVSLTAPALAGDSVLNVTDTSLMSLTAGHTATLFRSRTENEAVLIDALGANTITLRGQLVNSWPAGTPVYPAVVGHLPASVPLERLTGGVLQGAINVQADTSNTAVFMPSEAAGDTYNGYEVILTQPNWIRPVGNDHTYAFEDIDGGVGHIQWITSEEFPRVSRRYSWTLNGRQAIRDFRAFLARRKGQAKPFYAPTWHEDFAVLEPAVSLGQTYLAVRDNEFYRATGVDVTRDRLLIRMRSGQTFFRRITSVVDAGGGALQLTLDSTLSLMHQPSDFLGLHIVQLCRFATDKISLQWLTDRVATVETTLITVKE